MHREQRQSDVALSKDINNPYTNPCHDIPTPTNKLSIKEIQIIAAKLKKHKVTPKDSYTKQFTIGIGRIET